MNDNHALGIVRESLATARESLTDVHMTMPLDTITRRGRARRWRRRAAGLAGATAVAVAAAVGVTVALAPAGHEPRAQSGHLPAARLAAWTVDRSASGTIYVTIRELSDLAGLQRTLRADGVPASVTLASQRNRACHVYPNPGGSGPEAIVREFTPQLGATSKLAVSLTGNVAGFPAAGADVLYIDPSSLPHGAGLQITTDDAPSGPSFMVLVGLVSASAACTGS
jgi:hypothetical protein